MHTYIEEKLTNIHTNCYCITYLLASSDVSKGSNMVLQNNGEPGSAKNINFLFWGPRMNYKYYCIYYIIGLLAIFFFQKKADRQTHKQTHTKVREENCPNKDLIL